MTTIPRVDIDGPEADPPFGDVHEAAQDFEADWWGDCLLTFGEEAKQITYAHRMGLSSLQIDGQWPVYDLQQYSVADLGGGPCSILLKTINAAGRTVVDPCRFPEWVSARYAHAGIEYVRCNAENWQPEAKVSEVWIYNVLQHVVDPEKIIALAREHGYVLRIFEWIEKETNVGHPHTLHAHDLNRWIGGTGTVGLVDENGCYGLAYWGAFTL